MCLPLPSSTSVDNKPLLYESLAGGGDLKVHNKAFILWFTNTTISQCKMHLSHLPKLPSPNYLVLLKSPSLMSSPRVKASSGVSLCRNQNNGTRDCSSRNCLVIGKCTTSPGDAESCRVTCTLSPSISSSRAGQKRIVYPGIPSDRSHVGTTGR